MVFDIEKLTFIVCSHISTRNLTIFESTQLDHLILVVTRTRLIWIRWQGGTKQRGTTKGALTKEALTKGAPRPKGHCQRGTAKGAPD